ncbi:MAG: hypothetical protein WBN96_12660 [Gammaproteobacteria bacterium]
MNARSAARRADYMDVIRNLSSRATQQTRFCGFLFDVRRDGFAPYTGDRLNAVGTIGG